MKALVSVALLVSSFVLFGCASSEPPARSAPVDVPTAAGPIPAATQSAKPSKPAAAGACATDADCVPAECCHPKSCVPAGQRPACEATMCTRECRGGTFDCGGGGCQCQGGTCVAHLEQQPFHGK